MRWCANGAPHSSMSTMPVVPAPRRRRQVMTSVDEHTFSFVIFFGYSLSKEGPARDEGLCAVTHALRDGSRFLTSLTRSLSSLSFGAAHAIVSDIGILQSTSSPPFENLLRSVDLFEDVILALRARRSRIVISFVSFDSTEDGLRESAKDGLGFNVSKGFGLNTKMAKLLRAWTKAIVQSDTKMKVDVIAKAHEELTTMLHTDCTSLMVQFEDKYGNDISGEKLPVQCHVNAIEEKIDLRVIHVANFGEGAVELCR